MIPALEAQGIEKVVLNGDEETKVVKGIDLTLDRGELVALLGASGSGKSTLLSTIWTAAAAHGRMLDHPWRKGR